MNVGTNTNDSVKFVNSDAEYTRCGAIRTN